MESVQIVLAISLFLCSLVAGFVFAFAVVVMPGIKNLDDNLFLKSFKVMDRVIQENQPIFLAVWLGSAIAVIVLAVFAVLQLEGVNRMLAITCSAIYLLGVQLPTITINIPLNNRLQSLNLDEMDKLELDKERAEFELRWTRWNSIRTIVATIAVAGLIVLAIRI